jgi:FKBP-type peptidyl-prolyl cis-trans isomerase
MLIFFASCDDYQTKQQNTITITNLKDSLQEVNKAFVQRENLIIDRFVERSNKNFITTATGLRIFKSKENPYGLKARRNEWAKINFEVKLITGQRCYGSDDTGPVTFLIGKDDVESGLHEGIQYLNVGEKATFIIPSYLAHGFTGDMDKIPSRATLLVDVELLSLKN